MEIHEHRRRQGCLVRKGHQRPLAGGRQDVPRIYLLCFPIFYNDPVLLCNEKKNAPIDVLVKTRQRALSNFQMQERGCQKSTLLRAKAAPLAELCPRHLLPTQGWHLTVCLTLKQPSGLPCTLKTGFHCRAVNSRDAGLF